MYPEYMQESIRKIEKNRTQRLKLAKSGKPIFPLMTAKEREEVLNKFHPDYKKGSKRIINIGPNKGELITTEVADILVHRLAVEVALQPPDVGAFAAADLGDAHRDSGGATVGVCAIRQMVIDALVDGVG